MRTVCEPHWINVTLNESSCQLGSLPPSVSLSFPPSSLPVTLPHSFFFLSFCKPDPVIQGEATMLSTPFPCLSNKSVSYWQAGAFTDSHVGTLPAWKHTHTEPLVLSGDCTTRYFKDCNPAEVGMVSCWLPPSMVSLGLPVSFPLSLRPSRHPKGPVGRTHTRVLSRSPAAPAPAFLMAAGEISPLGEPWPGLPGHAPSADALQACVSHKGHPLHSAFDAAVLVELAVWGGRSEPHG